MGIILLAGGAEFNGKMAVPDRSAIQLAGGPHRPIRIIPTAAAPDNNHRRAGGNGVDWFKHLGAADVSWVPLIDNASADDDAICDELSQAGLIYLLGGFPRYLAQTLSGSRSWQAILSAYAAGAVIAGSSAGAMVLCEYYFDPGASRVLAGLGLLNGICVLPHHETFGRTWTAQLTELLPQAILVGIDEQTGVICNVSDGYGHVLGKGEMRIYNSGNIEVIESDREFNLSLLNIS